MSAIEELSEENFEYNKETNRIIITLSNDEKFSVSNSTLREVIPVIDEEEKIKELFMILHDMDKEVLTKANFYNKKMVELEKGIADARKKLEQADSMLEVKKWTAVVKSYVDSKNALAEVRRTIGLIDKISRKPIRLRVAALGHNPNEFI